MKKFLLFGVAGLLVLLIAGVLAAIVSINSLARKAIETGGTRALGARTTVSGVNVGLLSGKFSMSRLEIQNPAGGFSSPHFLTLGEGGVAVSLSTLRQPIVELPRLSLEDLDVNLEKKGGQTNYGAILDHLKQVTGGDKPAPAAEGEKRFIIRDLDLQQITVHVDLIGGPGAVGDLTRVTVPIDRIRLTDVGKTGTGVRGTGVTMTELSGIIVKAILAAAADKGGGVIPSELLGDLRGKLAALGDLDKIKTEVIAEVQGKIDDLGKKAVEDGKKKLDEAADKLKGLIPGGKKEGKP